MALRIWKWGILGCGKISHDFTNWLVQENRARVTACAARSADSSGYFATRFGIQKQCDDYLALCNDPDVDIIYVGTTHMQHKDHTIMALDSGKHVVCEKPMGINKNEVKEMIDAAKANNRFLMEAVWTRFAPAFVMARSHIEAGIIGEIVSYRGNFSVKMPSPEEAPRAWQLELGGGSTLDLSVYTLHYLPALFGAQSRPEIVQATGSLLNGVDTSWIANFKYEGYKYAQVSQDFYANGSNEHIIVGTKGIITLWDHVPTEYKLEIFDPETPHIRTPHKTTSQKFALPTGFVLPFNYYKSELLSEEIKGVMAALDLGLCEAPEYTWEEMRHRIEVSDELRRQLGVVYPSE